MSDIGSVTGITIQVKSYFSIIAILADKHKVRHSTLIQLAARFKTTIVTDDWVRNRTSKRPVVDGVSLGYRGSIGGNLECDRGHTQLIGTIGAEIIIQPRQDSLLMVFPAGTTQQSEIVEEHTITRVEPCLQIHGVAIYIRNPERGTDMYPTTLVSLLLLCKRNHAYETEQYSSQGLFHIHQY